VTFRGDYQFKPALPYTPGKGPAGIVRAVGEQVTDLAVGDRVLAMAEYGGHSEQAVIDQTQVYLLPPEVRFADAASMAVAYDTAWMALRDRARLARGEIVLVVGASGAVGRASVQLASAMGAGQVIAAVSDVTRPIDGADAVVDLSRPELQTALRDQVMELTNGRGVDVVIDMLGGDAFDGAVRAVAWRGRLVIVGFASGRIPVLRMNYPMLKNMEVSGLQISDYRKRLPNLVREAFESVFDLYVRHAVQLSECDILPLIEWREAMTRLAERSTHHRLVIDPCMPIMYT
jgi:NADPH2:quinone reductase